MGTVDLSGLPEQALLLVDSAPIIYVLDRHPELGPRFRPLFEAQEAGNLRFAITTVTVQLASAFAINADALVTYDRDFSRVKGLRIIC